MTTTLVVLASSAFLSSLCTVFWVTIRADRRSDLMLERVVAVCEAGMRRTELRAEAAEATVRSMVSSVEEQGRVVERTVRVVSEQAAETVRTMASEVCRAVSPPPLPATPPGSAGVPPGADLFGDRAPWETALHPEELRERVEEAGWSTPAEVQAQMSQPPPPPDPVPPGLAGDRVPLGLGLDPR